MPRFVACGRATPGSLWFANGIAGPQAAYKRVVRQIAPCVDITDKPREIHGELARMRVVHTLPVEAHGPARVLSRVPERRP
jgi:hypothetical protein